MLKRVLITGANAGLGKDSARQLALQDGIEKIYLGCRNEQKAKAAQKELEQITGKSIFEVFLVDVSNVESVRSAIAKLNEPIDGLIMNAGGMGGTDPGAKTKYGVTQMFATNVLGHAVLLEELLKEGKLTQVAIYAGSEAARGVFKMGMKQPKLPTSSVKEFQSVIDGSYFTNKFDPMEVYGFVKYIAAQWISSLSRKYPNVRLVTVSPGGTSGTDIGRDLPPLMKFLMTVLGTSVMPLMGMMHKLDVGAKRYVDVLTTDSYKSGVFYGSKKPVLTGPLIDQSTIMAEFRNQTIQDNAYQAIHSFLN